jgi:hypothetical protein
VILGIVEGVYCMATVTAKEVLNRVIAILEERERNYDSPLDNFERIAQVNSVVVGQALSAEQVAAWNIGQKLARLAYGMDNGLDCSDHWLDIVGYAVCGYRCQLEKEEREKGLLDYTATFTLTPEQSEDLTAQLKAALEQAGSLE